jgi:hypothetical protein
MRNSVYILCIGAAVTIGLTLLWLFSRHRVKMKHGEILPADVMKAKYALTAGRYEPPHLEREQVPPHLRDLIGLAERWGIPDDIIRDDFEQEATAAEKDEFQARLRGRTKDIREWLDSFETGRPMPEAPAHFMFMLEALDEMGLWPD